MRKMYPEDKAMVVILVVTTLILAVLLGIAIKGSNDFDADCAAIGGHTKTDTTVVTTVSGNGQVGTGSSSNTICLSDDGRILEP
jgi:hypothetical protein